MHSKPSARKADTQRDRNHRLAARRSLGCEKLESRILLDAGGIGPDGGLPDPLDPLPPLQPGAISGRVWEDTDGNRQYDGAELGMGGVTVFSDLNFNGVHESSEPSTVTSFDDPTTDFDEGGLYTLDNLQPGWHNVRQITPAGFEQTFPSLLPGHLPPPWGDPSVHVTFVGEGQTVDDVNFGNQQIEPGAVAGLKWEDVNGNAQRDPDELGLPGVIIFSDRNFNGIPDPDEPQIVTMEDDQSTDFDESGLYRLDGLEPGLHWIKEVVPDGFHQTFPLNPLLDPGAPPPFGLGGPGPFPGGGAHDVLIQPGQTIDGLDFGNQRVLPGSVHGVKWEDLNGNTIRDPGEVGLPGVVIYSDRNFNNVPDPDEPQTVTMADDPTTDFDESGLYSLHNLDPGWHWIKEVVPAGSVQTFPWFGLPHDVFILPGDSIENINFGNQPIAHGSISGVKWNDENGNAEFDPWERGLAGVTIYADLNDNGQLDFGEPNAITTADIPTTAVDEGGRYTLSNLTAGDYVIREVVPGGFHQTFPLSDLPRPQGPATSGSIPDGSTNPFATVTPSRLDFTLAPGDVEFADVAVTIHPNFIRPIEIGLETNPSTGMVINLSGIQSNGGGGSVSTFQIMVHSVGQPYEGELFFFDAGPAVDGAPIASIPLTINSGTPRDGAHRVTLVPGDHLDGIDFGNQALVTGPGGVAGRKWEDANGNGVQDPGESGLAGVMIYSDLNFNGVLDPNEPRTITTADIPETDFDEGGLYSLTLPPGQHWIAEVIPDGYLQTFPSHPVIAIFPPPPGGGVHEVTVVAGQTIDGLDFGNQPVDNGTVSGRKWLDLNGNAEHDPNEPGLAGVTIYADLNFNGQLDFGEPSTVTINDDPTTDFDEAGLYSLDTRPVFQAIREVVPVGFHQTFPTSDAASPLEQGAHFVNVLPNGHIGDLDFGNQPLDAFPASVSGRKWEDGNANGQQDADEFGVGGVTIYSDLNLNGVLDPDEPSTVTTFDDPTTDFDEGGLYLLDGLAADDHIIREVVPDGWVQTFPISIAASPLEQGAHFVQLAPGEHVGGLDFGNLRFGIPLPGDFNNDGFVDHGDLDYWEAHYGGGNAQASTDSASGGMSGSDFLTWQRNLGTVSTVPPASSSSVEVVVAPVAASVEVSTTPAATAEVDLAGLSLGGARTEYTNYRTRAAVVEAAFAETPASNWRSLELAPLTGQSSETLESSNASAEGRDDYEGLSAAIDAALESEFGM